MNAERNNPVKRSGVALVVASPSNLAGLIGASYRLASRRDETLHILVVTEGNHIPEWFELPEGCETGRINLETLDSGNPSKALARWFKTSTPLLVIASFDPEDIHSRHLVSRELDQALFRAKCPVALLSSDFGALPPGDLNPKGFIPYSGDRNFKFALDTALAVTPDTEITIVASGPEAFDQEERTARTREFHKSVEDYTADPRISTIALFGDTEINEFVDNAGEYNNMIVGTSRGNTFTRGMLGDRAAVELGDLARIIADRRAVPFVIVREYQGWFGSFFSSIMSRGGHLLPSVDNAERIEIYREVRRAARPRVDFFTMTALSAAIASFGLLLNSPAVIIGAMLIAPLMSAIIGMGLAMVQGNMRFLGMSIGAALRGGLAAVVVGLLVGFLNFSQEVTSEMLARAGPSLLDLAIAALSGAAAAYALCRKDVSASLPGVAISVALVPPLASTGLFLAIADWANAYGAFLLFLTNLAAIAFSSGFIFTMVGFRPAGTAGKDPQKLVAFRRSFLVFGLLILLVFTNLAVRTIDEQIDETFEDGINAIVTQYLSDTLEREIRLIGVNLIHGDNQVVDVLVRTSSTKDITEQEVEELAEILAQKSESPVRVSVTNIPLISAIAGYTEKNVE